MYICIHSRNTFSVISCFTIFLILVFDLIILSNQVIAQAPDLVTIDLPNLPSDARPLRLIRIPAGTFWMGNTGEVRDQSCWCSNCDCEKPRHEVTIGYDFYIGETEVTQAQWQSVMGSYPATGRGVGSNYPVYSISWNECQSFVIALNGLDQGVFRLSSEAEWEYACRGPASNPVRYSPFSFGDDTSVDLGDPLSSVGCSFSSLFNQYMWWCGNAGSQAHDVTEKLPNPWGLYGMHGNVWEWCEDEWHSNYTDAPTDGSAWKTDGGSSHVWRGGSWLDNAVLCRSAMRTSSSAPSANLGLRVVMDTDCPSVSPTETPVVHDTPIDTATETPTPAFGEYQQIRYVSISTGSDVTGDGSQSNPWQNLTFALSQITDAGSANRYKILIAAGTYTGTGDTAFIMKPWVDLYGGYSASDWSRNTKDFLTVLDGQDTRSVVMAASNMIFDGINVARGRVVDLIIGAGITFDSVTSSTFSNCDIYQNHKVKTDPAADVSGGGGVNIINESSPRLKNCLIHDNTCLDWTNGGGINCDHSSPTLDSCSIENNESGSGGGVACNYSNAVLTNCLIAGNKIFWAGNAFYSDFSSTSFFNCTIVNNTGGSWNYVMHLGQQPSYIVNCVIYFNQGTPVAPVWGGVAYVSYSDVEGGYVGTGNINIDPLFIDTANGDYHLQANSPCVDAGIGPLADPDVPTEDIEGDIRSGETCDMGVDERDGSNPPQPTPTSTFPGPTPTPTFETEWELVANMDTPRLLHEAVVLDDGRILIIGGQGITPNIATDKCEIFDPVNNTLTPAASLNTPRLAHAAIKLDNGNILVVGGSPNNTAQSNDLSSCEIYDIGTNTWSFTGSLSEKSNLIEVQPLSNGKVLRIGGTGSSGFGTRTCEIYDPATGIWTPTGYLNTQRESCGVTRLFDGRILVAGGYGFTSSVEIYNELLESWTNIAGGLPSPRSYGEIVQVSDGKALLMGGVYWSGRHYNYDTVQFFDPENNTLSTGPSMPTRRSMFQFVKYLDDGAEKVVAIGGLSNSETGPDYSSHAVSDCDIYDVESNNWSPGPPLNHARYLFTGLYTNGSVYAIGGAGVESGTVLTSIEKLAINPIDCTLCGDTNLGRGDSEPPVLTVPTSIKIECNESTDPSNTGIATAEDNCDPAPVITHSDVVTPGDCSQESVVTRTWTATDACGNSSPDGVQVITVEDTTAPALTVPASITVECDESIEPINTGDATATDNCDPAPVITHSDVVTPSDCPQEFLITRTWTATDACGNPSTGVQEITVEDTQGPTIIYSSVDPVPAEPGLCNAVVQFPNPAVTDNCDPQPIWSCQPPSGSIFPVGTTEVRCTAEDCVGNKSSQCSFLVTVEDKEAPEISLNSTEITVIDTDCSGSELVSVPDATAVDNCDGFVPVILEPEDLYTPGQNTFEFLAGQVTPVEYTATDSSGNEATKTLQVRVLYGANILVKADMHTVGSGQNPGVTKEPLVGIEVSAYDKSEFSCAREECGGISHQYYQCIVDTCEPVATEVTDANGEVLLNLPPGDYVIVSDDATKTVLPDPLGVSASDLQCGETMQKYLQQIVTVNDKKVPGKTTKLTGSELLVIQPEFIVWDDTEQLYPFVFESIGDWGVTVSVEPPGGFEADIERLSTEVDTEMEGLQFTVTEVGSDLVPTQTEFDVKHKGKKIKFRNKVDILLTPEYARSRGFNVDVLRAEGLIREHPEHPENPGHRH